jgi:alpha-L-fucosidase
LPGGNTAGFNTREIGTLPLETSLTMNNSWGFNITDQKFKSTKDLIGFLVRAAGNGANLLLNVGPRPDGTLQPEAVARLQEIGAWLQRYGVSIYGTRQGPVAPQPWGATTRKDNTIYVHVLDPAATSITLAASLGPIGGAAMLSTNERVDTTETAAGLKITLPQTTTSDIDRIVILRLGADARY